MITKIVLFIRITQASYFHLFKQSQNLFLLIFIIVKSWKNSFFDSLTVGFFDFFSKIVSSDIQSLEGTLFHYCQKSVSKFFLKFCKIVSDSFPLSIFWFLYKTIFTSKPPITSSFSPSFKQSERFRFLRERTYLRRRTSSAVAVALTKLSQISSEVIFLQLVLNCLKSSLRPSSLRVFW